MVQTHQRQGIARFAAAATAAVTLYGCGGGGPAQQTIETVLLNSASQDRQVYLSWNQIANTSQTVVRWRPQASADWAIQSVDQGCSALVAGLENGRGYEFAVDVTTSSAVLHSAVTVQVPRLRDTVSYLRFSPYAPALNLFTAQPAMDDWLKVNGIDSSSLTLRGRPIRTWDERSRDGLYTSPDLQQGLLLRTADSVFRPPFAVPDPSAVRTILRKTLWPSGDPYQSPSRFSIQINSIVAPMVGSLKTTVVKSFEIRYHPLLASRVTYLYPAHPLPGRIAIYHEGHGGSALAIGTDVIQFLLDRGWQVVTMDMPLIGANAPDAQGSLDSHFAFDGLDNGSDCPVGLFLLPVKALVDKIVAEQPRGVPLTVMMIGRSGGGWTTYAFSALDSRIDIAVSIAGGTPISQRLAAGPAELGDYEQFAPRLYDCVSHENMMTSAGARGAFYIYNTNDPCCFRAQPNDVFVQYLRSATAQSARPVGVYVDSVNSQHSASPAALSALDSFLNGILGAH